jgi:hypothetical protein
MPVKKTKKPTPSLVSLIHEFGNAMHRFGKAEAYLKVTGADDYGLKHSEKAASDLYRVIEQLVGIRN